MNMQKNYVQVVVDSLNERFLEFLVFIASKLFSPKYFPIEEETHINIVKTLMHECENKSLLQA